MLSVRLLNLELLQNYAPDVWLMYNNELERSKARASKELESLKKGAEAVSVCEMPLDTLEYILLKKAWLPCITLIRFRKSVSCLLESSMKYLQHLLRHGCNYML
jgi:hypothetical protein